MKQTKPKHQREELESLNRLVRVARGLEAGGFYNASKLFWALAFSEQIRESNAKGIPSAGDELDAEIDAALNDLAAKGTLPLILDAIRKGRQAARENRAIPLSEIPPVSVCRTCGETFLGKPPDLCPICGAHALSLREFPPIYFLEPLAPTLALAALASAPGEIEEAVQGLDEKQMAQAPKENEWAVRNVLSHVFVTQALLAGRVDKILAEENPSLSGVAAWALGNQDALTSRELLARYRQSRQETVERLEGISWADWWRPARHEEFGEVTLLQQASYFAKHERYHLPQIQAIRQAIGATAPGSSVPRKKPV